MATDWSPISNTTQQWTDNTGLDAAVEGKTYNNFIDTYNDSTEFYNGYDPTDPDVIPETRTDWTNNSSSTADWTPS